MIFYVMLWSILLGLLIMQYSACQICTSFSLISRPLLFENCQCDYALGHDVFSMLSLEAKDYMSENCDL